MVDDYTFFLEEYLIILLSEKWFLWAGKIDEQSMLMLFYENWRKTRNLVWTYLWSVVNTLDPCRGDDAVVFLSFFF